MKKLIAAPALLVVLSLLNACADTPPPAAPKEYVLPPKINLDVQILSMTDRSGIQPASSPYNSNDFQPTIAQAIRQWAKDRLQAVGPSGQAMVIIKDASLVQQPIPYQHDWFTRQQASKYVAHAAVDIEAKGRDGYALATAEATRFTTLPENPTADERRKAYFDVLNGLMRDLGQHLEGSMQEHMHDFIVTVPMFENSMDNGSVPPVPVTPMVSPVGSSSQTVPLSGLPLSGAVSSGSNSGVVSDPSMAPTVSPAMIGDPYSRPDSYPAP